MPVDEEVAADISRFYPYVGLLAQCRSCAALLPSDPDSMKLHREWHEERNA